MFLIINLGLFVIIFMMYYLFLRLVRMVHMFQQNSYDPKKFVKWINVNKEFVIGYNNLYLLVPVILLPLIPIISIVIFSVILFFNVQLFNVYVSNRRQKKALVVTARVKRLFVSFGVFFFLIVCIMYFISNLFIIDYNIFYNIKIYISLILFLLVLINLMVGYIIILINYINFPIEFLIRYYYLRMSRSKLKKYNNLLKVGITGSYGKTSVKEISATILSEESSVLYSPGSFNTPMGLSITIRKYLKPIHNVFIAEMGAYKLGEIEELVDLINPKIGILTSIGPQHLDTFESIDNVIKTKFEIIENLSSDGIGIINIDNDYIKNYSIKNDIRLLKYSIEDKDADVYGSDIKYNSNGMSFKVNIKELKKSFSVQTDLLSKHNVSNILAGITLAYVLGHDIKSIENGCKKILPVKHRLELKQINDRLTIIDDAFNSNPVSSKLAVDTLSEFSGEKIIVTPGMISLGDQEYKLNYEFGVYMASRVDKIILIKSSSSMAILDGIKSSSNEDKVILFDDVLDALEEVYKGRKKRVVLLENDLPDIFS